VVKLPTLHKTAGWGPDGALGAHRGKHSHCVDDQKKKKKGGKNGSFGRE